MGSGMMAAEIERGCNRPMRKADIAGEQRVGAEPAPAAGRGKPVEDRRDVMDGHEIFELV